MKTTTLILQEAVCSSWHIGGSDFENHPYLPQNPRAAAAIYSMKSKDNNSTKSNRKPSVVEVKKSAQIPELVHLIIPANLQFLQALRIPAPLVESTP